MKKLDLLLEEFDNNDIELDFDSTGVFSFSSLNELKQAQAIVENLNCKYSMDPYLLTIKIYNDVETPAEVEALREEYFNYLKDSYENNKLSADEYKAKLQELSESIKSPEFDDKDILEMALEYEGEYSLNEQDAEYVRAFVLDETYDEEFTEAVMCKLHDMYCEKQAAKDIEEAVGLEETYSEKELHSFLNKTFNQQKVLNIYRRKKYNDKRLYAHTKCIKCGREKRVFLSNLINDPDKYGSCVCSEANVNGKLDHINDLYSGDKKLSNNTSGHTGVTYVKEYRGKLYDKWRAYIDLEGKRHYLGDFSSKTAAIKAREAAAKKGIKWYKENKHKFMKNIRRKSKSKRASIFHKGRKKSK